MQDDLNLDDVVYEWTLEFEIDVRKVVLVNHELTLEAITKAEDEAVDGFDLTDEGQRQTADYVGRQHDEFRRAATNLALVGLVARFHHWLTYLANRIRGKNNQIFHKNVVQEISFLNSQLKNSPHKPEHFEKWADVRDSVIHADSKASWTFNGETRTVDERFTLGEELNFTEDDLKEAFDHTLAPGKVSQGRAYGPFFLPFGLLGGRTIGSSSDSGNDLTSLRSDAAARGIL